MMVVVSDFDMIQMIADGILEIHQYDALSQQPASLDLKLGETLYALPPREITLDPRVDQSSTYTEVPVASDGSWTLEPGRGYLGVTQEAIQIPMDHVGFLHGVSSVGRLFLLIHVTAGLADPGFYGRLTLELISLSNPLKIYPGMRIGQLTLHELSSPSIKGYQGRYQGDIDPVPSRAFLDQ